MTVTAVVGTYRKGGVIDRLVDEILDAVRERGARTEKVYLIDEPIEFCRNCRACTQEAGGARGACPIEDGMGRVLAAIDRSDALVLASPMNVGTVTAVTKRFIERLTCFVYWPWGMNAPKVRNPRRDKRAVLVASSAAPAFVARLTTRMVGLMKKAAGMLGARTVGVLFLGLAAGEPSPKIGARARRRARRLGARLVPVVRGGPDPA